MKTYTQKERKQAMDALPIPASDFLKSKTITDTYVGIGKKLGLNFRQEGLASEITNVILLGLEPEHALETNLHQALPELSNTTTRELVADINDRIFKEIQRRIKENITEPKQVWDEVELGPEPTEEDDERNKAREREDAENPIPYEELLKLAEQEKVERKAKEDAEEAEAEKKRLATVPPTPEETIDTSTSSIVAEKLGLAPDVSPENKKNEEEILKTAPTETQNSVPLKSKLTEPTKPVYKGGVDPYREPVE